MQPREKNDMIELKYSESATYKRDMQTIQISESSRMRAL